MKPSYSAELDRLLKLGIITDVIEYTGWVNSTIPVKKPGGSLRLCLDPKDLNKNIKQNQWYSKTFDGILPGLPCCTLFTLLDAKFGYLNVILDIASSLMTTFKPHGADSDGYNYHLDSKWQEISSKKDLTEYSEAFQMSTTFQMMPS